MFLNTDYNSVVSVLSDPVSPLKIFPQVKECSIVKNECPDTCRKISAGYDVMGVGLHYNYIDRITEVEESDSSFFIKSVLFDSLDKKIEDYHGYWKIEKIDSEIYQNLIKVSLSSYYKYVKPFQFQKEIIQTLVSNESVRMFYNLKDAAESTTAKE
ncbi:MAG: hypothetical protein PQJ46_10725 [Spirochaetales bacterium]|nr:hypothetical protein [Spirochaetales bacterium]